MPTALDILQQTFGYPSFREPQETIIQTVINGGDALVLMPTGGGKSLCYQIPALARPGCGIVISPLIALMQDQVNAMRELGVRAEIDWQPRQTGDVSRTWADVSAAREALGYDPQVSFEEGVKRFAAWLASGVSS